MVLSLFRRNRQQEVQSFVLNLLNNQSSGLQIGNEELRFESRINLTIVVLVVPIKNNKPQVDQCLTTVTKDFSSSGVSIVLSEPHPFDKVILGFQRRGSTTFIQAQAKHLSPMGAGFYKLGLKLEEVVSTDAYPELEDLSNRF